MSQLTLSVVKILFLCAIAIFLNIVFVGFIKDILALRIAQVMLVCGLSTIIWLEIQKNLKVNKIFVDKIPHKKVFKYVNFDIGVDQFVAVYAKTAVHFLKHCLPAGLISEKDMSYIYNSMSTIFNHDSFMFKMGTHTVLPNGNFDLALLLRYVEAIIKNHIDDSLSKEDALIMLPRIYELAKNNSESAPFNHIADAFNVYTTHNINQYETCINNLKQLIALLQQKTGVHFVIKKYIDYDFGKNTESFAFDSNTNINAKSLSKEQWHQANQILKFIEYFKVDLSALYAQA